MVKKNLAVKMLAAGALLAGLVQADWHTNPIGPTNTTLNTTTNWQNVGTISWLDATGDGIIEVNESVTFTVEVEKYTMGTHLFDALKVWVGEDVVKMDQWNLTASHDEIVNLTYTSEFTLSFDAVGTYDLTARVTCSDDLADVSKDLFTSPYSGRTWADEGKEWNYNYGWVKTSTDRVTTQDWDAWAIDRYMWQGDTKELSFDVVSQNVPEPGIISLLGFGLLGLAFMRRKK